MTNLPAMPPPPPGEGSVPAAPVGNAHPRWPKILGVIALLVGLLDMLGAPSTWMGLNGVTDDVIIQDVNLTAWMRLLPQWYRNGPVVDLLLGGLLLVAAILLLKHRRSAWALFLTWGPLCLVWRTISIAAFAIAIPKAAETDSPFPIELIALILTIVTMCVYCALPVFSMIWLLRRRIAKQVAGWE